MTTSSPQDKGRRPSPAPEKSRRRIRVSLNGYGPDAFTALPQDLLAAFMKFPWSGAAEMKVALAIAAATYQDHRHRGQPVALSYGEIGKATQLTRMQVRNCLKKLEEDGVIEVDRGPRPTHRHQYKLWSPTTTAEGELWSPTTTVGGSTVVTHDYSSNSHKEVHKELLKKGPGSTAPLRGAAPPSPNGKPQGEGSCARELSGLAS